MLESCQLLLPLAFQPMDRTVGNEICGCEAVCNVFI